MTSCTTVKRPKIDHAAATLELRASGVEPVDEYPGVTRKPFRVRCLRLACPAHSEPFTVYLSQVRQLTRKREVACLTCRERKRANNRRADMIRLGHVLPMEVVVDVKTPTRCWCLRCWKVLDSPGPKLGNIRNGKQGGCTYCGGKTRLPDEAARQLARDWGYIPDPNIPYTNDATKWPGHCIARRHPCAPVLSSRNRSGPCETCADHGFKPDKPALLYLVVRTELGAAKIGICEDSPKNTRLREHARNGWTSVETMRFEVGAAARRVEDTVVRSWRARGLEPVLDNGIGYDGYSETVSLSAISVVEIWTAVRSTTEDLSATLVTSAEGKASRPSSRVRREASGLQTTSENVPTPDEKLPLTMARGFSLNAPVADDVAALTLW